MITTTTKLMIMVLVKITLIKTRATNKMIKVTTSTMSLPSTSFIKGVIRYIVQHTWHWTPYLS